MTTGAADRLGPLLERAFAGELPIRVKAWDGSQVGPVDAPAVVLRSRRALRRLLWAPGELGLAQAYVAGDIDLEGDLADGLRRIWAIARGRKMPDVHLRGRRLLDGTRVAIRLGVLGPRPGPPLRRLAWRERGTAGTGIGRPSPTTTTFRTSSMRWCWTPKWSTRAAIGSATPMTRPTRSQTPNWTSWT